MEVQWNHKVLNVSAGDFDALALEIFRFQYAQNPVYKSYVDALGINPAQIRAIEQIPFLPIRFFKSHHVASTTFEPVATFESSGTTGTINSRHYIKDLSIYRDSFTRAFELFYGKPTDWCIIGLLPSYLERSNSSLVVMVNELVQQSAHPQSGFYLHDYDKLATVLTQLEAQQQKTLLIGVSFALLDMAASHPLPLAHTIIMETGGMKGRRKEMIRDEMHEVLKQAFGVSSIHSEYGMTELLSQAYSSGNGIFHCPPWMKVLVREEEDPLTIKMVKSVKPVSGVINVIDLANIYSCSFIATDDAGRVYPGGSFEVMGRIDNSDIRGCSLMVV
jgi:phenylacetate-coenzyme A ligase PaaK-like adenylate-forming protein